MTTLALCCWAEEDTRVRETSTRRARGHLGVTRGGAARRARAYLCAVSEQSAAILASEASTGILLLHDTSTLLVYTTKYNNVLELEM